jgi:GTP-binding protein EngB required for normal cell division
MTESSPAAAGQAAAGRALPARLAALARLIQIGAARSAGGGFSEDVLSAAEALLGRAGERLRLSSVHTVVALAGGTGSGKSSLFNRLAGADFSTVGVTRPVTKDVHACVWGVAGSGSLLEWLGVPRRYRFARASALDRGEDSLTGLVLLDLPDHDSVMTHASDLVDRLVGRADLMVWVLDPQKYADAAVHRRFLVPLAGHSEVIAVVLNQSDLLTGSQIEDCVGDLRRLLDSEELHDVQTLVTSAATGEGMEELRKLLIDAVAARRAASDRIAADVDSIVARFAPYAGDAGAEGAAAGAEGRPAEGAGAEGTAAEGTVAGGSAAEGSAAGAALGSAGGVPAGATDHLVEAFSRAAGIPAVGDALQSARELRAADYVGWPVSWLAERLRGRDPVRKIRLGELWEDLRAVTAGPSGAQQSEIDNALTRLADEVGPPLPEPWSQTARAAVRSRAAEIPGALGTVMGESLPPENKVPAWWRFVAAWQGLLLGSVIVGLTWMAAIVVFGVFHVGSNVPRLFTDLSLLAWIAALIGAMLALGALTASACLNLVRAAAADESRQVASLMRKRMAVVAREMVIVPAEQELSELGRFREELRVAAGQPR